jgi:L-aspartate oxidase
MNRVIVVGGGAAGLAAALRLSERMRVTLLCKAPLGHDTATGMAQGGIAASLGPGDSPALHAHDTERIGGGLNDRRAVEILVSDAAQRITELVALGTSFDRESADRLAFGQEAAHSRRRILHAGGDATGHEIQRALTEAVRHSSITVVEARVEELLLDEGRIYGVRALRGSDVIEVLRFEASAVVLATGGCGRLFSHTTNPASATGDGIALAAAAGADLIDLEFVQFHPTALAAGLDPMPLITEALRGEGARLVDRDGRPLMEGRDPLGDLAPRDVVARIVFEAILEGREPALDARAIDRLSARFPTVSAAVRAAGFDPARDLLPVAPAAHSHMGGIAVDLAGRTSLTGLWACGETASTGAHGANRLASNSLLEALVFAARVADDILADPAPSSALPAVRITVEGASARPNPRLAREMERELRAAMYQGVGVVRDGASLRATLRTLDRLGVHGVYSKEVLTARCIAEAALRREESRGAHYRRDFPLADSRFARRLVFR